MTRKFSIDWPTYSGIACTALLTIFAVYLKRKEKWTRTDAEGFLYSCVGAPLFGIATCIVLHEGKRERTDAPRIVNLLQEKLAKN